MNRTNSGVDMRGFRWWLGGLEDKLDHDLNRARSELALLQREASDLDASREQKLRERDAELACAGTLLAGAMDPVAYTRCLRFLSMAEARLQECRRQAEQLGTRVAAARDACVEADRKRASVESLRDGAQRVFALEQSRRDAKEADRAWLATAGGVRRSGKRVEIPR